MATSVHSTTPPPHHHHAVRFYENDKSLSQIVAQFLGDGLTAGSPGIVVATADQRGAILRELLARSVDVERLQQTGELTLLDAEDALSTFMVDGRPVPQQFNDIVGGFIRKACRGRADRTVRIYGQMVDVLWQAGEHEAAIRLEMLWNQLAHTENYSLLCGYAMGHFYKDAHFDDVCGQHTHVVSADGESAPMPCDRRVIRRPNGGSRASGDYA